MTISNMRVAKYFTIKKSEIRKNRWKGCSEDFQEAKKIEKPIFLILYN